MTPLDVLTDAWPCADGQALVKTNGVLGCVTQTTPPAGTTPVASTCPAGQYVSGINGNGSVICTPLPASGGGGPVIPTNCPTGQVLTTQNGQIVCIAPTVTSGASCTEYFYKTTSMTEKYYPTGAAFMTFAPGSGASIRGRTQQLVIGITPVTMSLITPFSLQRPSRTVAWRKMVEFALQCRNGQWVYIDQTMLQYLPPYDPIPGSATMIDLWIPPVLPTP
jgi:hypothetical protein